ncbi:MAG: integration host factor subunit alpha [Desulfarculales bacterium]|jgi:integration host factor subunit alpha|nr:integration host factor subunit alpha [Desulfarculales bacterium]
MALTKADIVAAIYGQGLLNKADAGQAVETVLTLIKHRLMAGEEVLLSGFGKWGVRAKSERAGRNPQTGAHIALQSRKIVYFKPSKLFRNSVNEPE